jgi:TPR repeat protein
MCAIEIIHHAWNEHDQAVEWFTKGAEAGVPRAMYHIGYCLDMGEGVAAPDSQAAAEWHMRAAEGGFGEAASALSHMYTLGRGRAWHMMPATLSSTLKTLASRAR